MVFANLFRRNPQEAAATALYVEIVRQSRLPAFYMVAAVPDTVDGRFEMISLHAFLVMRHLKGRGEAAQKLSQTLFDQMFADMDQSLREIGIGDLSIGKHIKKMAKAFYGRVAAYEAALDGGGESLEDALKRDHYGSVEEVPADAVRRLADYVRAADARLAAAGLDPLMAGKVDFGDFDGSATTAE
ncbi:ubiquinol-cytochrome C chaperone family protein [uncultured Sneathiella sp.]|uniref:ubiquinol-cytochrome C chaperone family protein n=1 Tax=uncultured Sneathiella sp. TaxID=879315 RepID=UPI0030DC4782